MYALDGARHGEDAPQLQVGLRVRCAAGLGQDDGAAGRREDAGTRATRRSAARLDEGAQSPEAGMLRGIANWQAMTIDETFAPENAGSRRSHRRRDRGRARPGAVRHGLRHLDPRRARARVLCPPVAGDDDGELGAAPRRVARPARRRRRVRRRRAPRHARRRSTTRRRCCARVASTSSCRSKRRSRSLTDRAGPALRDQGARSDRRGLARRLRDLRPRARRPRPDHLAQRPARRRRAPLRRSRGHRRTSSSTASRSSATASSPAPRPAPCCAAAATPRPSPPASQSATISR